MTPEPASITLPSLQTAEVLQIWHSNNYDEETPTWETVAQYEYDGLNRRVKKDLASGTDVVYLYDGWQVIEEREYDAGDDAWEARRQFVYGGLYIDEPVALDVDDDSDGDCTDGNGGSTRYLYAQNANFNVMALADAAGSAVETVKYDPYGQPTCRRVSDSHEQPASHFGNTYLFTGRRYDDESGLFYARNRSYHPVLGRWMQRDPIETVPISGAFTYVVGNPLQYTDALGLQATSGPGSQPSSGATSSVPHWGDVSIHQGPELLENKRPDWRVFLALPWYGPSYAGSKTTGFLQICRLQIWVWHKTGEVELKGRLSIDFVPWSRLRVSRAGDHWIIIDKKANERVKFTPELKGVCMYKEYRNCRVAFAPKNIVPPRFVRWDRFMWSIPIDEGDKRTMATIGQLEKLWWEMPDPAMDIEIVYRYINPPCCRGVRLGLWGEKDVEEGPVEESLCIGLDCYTRDQGGR